MKKIIAHIIVIMVLCAAEKNVSAQDIIIKQNGDVIKAKIIEIGIDEVKFKYYDVPEGPTVTMKKSEIKTMKLEGKTEQIIDVQDDPRSISNKAILDKGSSLKFHFFSPLKNHLAFSYEWVNKPGFNWEVGIGIIGPGVSVVNKALNASPRGMFIRGGPKFLLGSASDIEIEGAKYAHPLKGRYFKIEVILNTLATTYSVDTFATWPNQGSGTVRFTNKYQSIAFNLIYGRQFIFGNTITVSWYAGVGYGFENQTTDLQNKNYWWTYDPRRYSHSYWGKNFPLTTTLGLTIGYILRTPDWLSRGSLDYTKRPGRYYKEGAQKRKPS